MVMPPTSERATQAALGVESCVVTAIFFLGAFFARR